MLWKGRIQIETNWIRWFWLWFLTKSIKMVIFVIKSGVKSRQKATFSQIRRKWWFWGSKMPLFGGVQKDPKNVVFQIGWKNDPLVFWPDFRYLRLKTCFLLKMEIAQNVPRIRHLLERPRRTFPRPEGHRNRTKHPIPHRMWQIAQNTDFPRTFLLRNRTIRAFRPNSFDMTNCRW